MLGTSKFIDYAITSADQDSDWPASNLEILNSSTEAWRSTGKLETEIRIDLTEAKQNPTIGLYRCNFTSVTIQGNDSDVWTSPSFSQAYTAVQDPDHFIYKLRKDLGASFNYRYLSIIIGAQDPIDGATYFEIGALPIIDNANLENFNAEPQSTFEHPLNFSTTVQEFINEFETGRMDHLPAHDLLQSDLSLPGHFLNNTANRLKLAEVFNHPLRPVIYLDFETGEDWEWYLLQRSGGVFNASKNRPKSRQINLNLRTIL